MKIVLILMIISTSAFSMTKEDAKSLYDLNKQVMNKKEIQADYAVCIWQNELAELASEVPYFCSRRKSAVDDTSIGDKVVNNTLAQANQMNKYEDMMTKKEFELEMNKAINRMQRNYGL